MLMWQGWSLPKILQVLWLVKVRFFLLRFSFTWPYSPTTFPEHFFHYWDPWSYGKKGISWDAPPPHVGSKPLGWRLAFLGHQGFPNQAFICHWYWEGFCIPRYIRLYHCNVYETLPAKSTLKKHPMKDFESSFSDFKLLRTWMGSTLHNLEVCSSSRCVENDGGIGLYLGLIRSQRKICFKSQQHKLCQRKRCKKSDRKNIKNGTYSYMAILGEYMILAIHITCGMASFSTRGWTFSYWGTIEIVMIAASHLEGRHFSFRKKLLLWHWRKVSWTPLQ